MIARTAAVYKNSFSGLSRSVWLLSLVSLINRSGTMVIPFLTIYLTTQLGFTLGQAGLAMTFFGLGSVAGSFWGGRFTDKIGYYPVQFWSLFLGGVMFLVLQFMHSIWQVWITIFFLSLIAEAFRPANMTAIAIYSEPENRTRSFSLMRISINLGWSVGPAIGGWLAATVGYQTLFWVDGLTCIAAAFIFRFFLPKKQPVESGQEEEKSARQAASVYKDKVFLFFLALTTITAIVFLQFLSTLPVFYKQEIGMSEAEIGALFALNGALIVVLEMPLVYLFEKKLRPLNCIIWGLLLYGFTYVVFNAAGATLFVAVISMLALTFGEIFNMPFTNSFALSRASAASRGQYMGLFTMTFSVAHIFAPTVGMQIAEKWGFAALWWVLGGLTLLAFAGFNYLKKMVNASTAGKFESSKSPEAANAIEKLEQV